MKNGDTGNTKLNKGYTLSSISAKATEVPQFCPVVSCWNINIVVPVQCYLPSTKACVILIVAEASSKTLMLSIMIFLVEFELIVELKLLSKGSGLKKLSIMKWHKVAYAAQKSTPATYVLSKFWLRFQGFGCPFKGNLLSSKNIQVAKGLKDKRVRFSCMKFILTWI